MRMLHGWVDYIDAEDRDVFVRVLDPDDDKGADVPFDMWPEAELPTLREGTYIECMVDDEDKIISIKKMVVPVWTEEEIERAKQEAKNRSARLFKCF